MHKRNLNHSELYLLTTTLYLSNTPPAPTPKINIYQSRSCLICGTSVAVWKKSNMAPPRWFPFWQNLHNSSVPLNSLSCQPIQHMGGRVLLCVLQLAYLYCTWRTHAWRNFHLGPYLPTLPIFAGDSRFHCPLPVSSRGHISPAFLPISDKIRFTQDCFHSDFNTATPLFGFHGSVACATESLRGWGR